MKLQHRLSFVVPVLMVAGTLNSIWAYYARGISGLRISVEAWLIGSTAAILLNLFLRRLSENTNQDGGKAKERWVDESWIGWVFVPVGAAAGAYASGVVRGVALAALTVVTVLVILLFGRLAVRRKKA